ncbi:MAG: hypothetical protein R2788_06180 [Saprospiraceae bacterium]
MDTLTADLLQSCKILIASAKTDEAINTLMNSFAKSQHDILILSGQWAELKNQKITNTISLDDFKRESSRINKSILEVLDKLEKDTNQLIVKNKLGEDDEVVDRVEKKIRFKNRKSLIISLVIIFVISSLGIYKGINYSVNNDSYDTNLLDQAEDYWTDEKYFQAYETYKRFNKEMEHADVANIVQNDDYIFAWKRRLNSLRRHFTLKSRNENTENTGDLLLEECSNYESIFNADKLSIDIRNSVKNKLEEIRIK